MFKLKPKINKYYISKEVRCNYSRLNRSQTTPYVKIIIIMVAYSFIGLQSCIFLIMNDVSQCHMTHIVLMNWYNTSDIFIQVLFGE